jgi:hypothetical protein
VALARSMRSTTRACSSCDRLRAGGEREALGDDLGEASISGLASGRPLASSRKARPRVGRSATQGLRDEAAAEIGREQPGCLHELIGHDHGDGFRGQQAKQN